jgi:cytochrome oxidase Cu insertion factor (SCO1/SenC/PrrC family)
MDRVKMVDIPKNINSKRFLLTYLVIIMFLLLLWVIQLRAVHEDKREIPIEMLAYVESPPRVLPEMSLGFINKQALTNAWLKGKWTFVYFSHSNCLPLCRPALQAMDYIQSSFVNNHFQFLVIGLDGDNETQTNLTEFLTSQQFDFDVATASSAKIEETAREFKALFLKTRTPDGRYAIEQEHHIFVLDPKGRIYATLRPPFSIKVQEDVLNLRDFYARSE